MLWDWFEEEGQAEAWAWDPGRIGAAGKRGGRGKEKGGEKGETCLPPLGWFFVCSENLNKRGKLR